MPCNMHRATVILSELVSSFLAAHQHRKYCWY